LFVYVNNILSLSHQVKEAIAEITSFYKEKDRSIKEPEFYLGTNIEKFQLPDRCKVWTSSARSYCKNAVDIVKCLLLEDGKGYVLKSKVKYLFPTGYKPELDATKELGNKLASRYMQLIRILHWAIELGRLT